MKLKGVITVFLAMTLTVLLMLLLGLLEVGRLTGSKAVAKMEDEAGVDSVFAEYDRSLFDRYGVFFLPGNYGREAFAIEDVETRLADMLNMGQSKNMLLASSVKDIEITGYELMTDRKGLAYQKQAADAMYYTLGEKAIGKLVNGQSGTAESKAASDTLSAGELFQSVENAKEVAEEVPEEERSKVESTVSKEEAEGIFTFLKQLLGRGVLGLVVDSSETISGKSISDCYSKRSSAQSGSKELAEEETAVQKVLFREYLLDKFGNYRGQKEDTAMDYELEYVLFGKFSDEENLKAMVTRLLGVRTAINYAYLLTDAGKQEEVSSVAIALVGFSGNPLLIEAAKQGILAGWAYAESIAEVRTLLGGGKAAIVKNAENWRTDLFRLVSPSEANEEGKGGLSYEDYLRFFLYAETSDKSATRSLDLIEKNIREEEYHESFRVDYCISGFSVTIQRTSPARFATLGKQGMFLGQIEDQITYQYR